MNQPQPQLPPNKYICSYVGFEPTTIWSPAHLARGYPLGCSLLGWCHSRFPGRGRRDCEREESDPVSNIRVCSVNRLPPLPALFPDKHAQTCRHFDPPRGLFWTYNGPRDSPSAQPSSHCLCMRNMPWLSRVNETERRPVQLTGVQITSMHLTQVHIVQGTGGNKWGLPQPWECFSVSALLKPLTIHWQRFTAT